MTSFSETTKTRRVKTVTGWATYKAVEAVDPYPGRADDEVLESYPCGKCGGKGTISAYYYVSGGVCFQCEGDSSYRDVVTVGDERKAAAAVAKVENGFRAREARRAAFLDVHPTWARGDHVILRDLILRAAEGKKLSERQIALGDKIAAEVAAKREEKVSRVAEDENAAPVPTARVEVLGEVLALRWQDNRFAVAGGRDLKLLVKDDRGFKVWGTCPSAILADVERGSRVTFTATLEPSADDETFGFFKRPTKAAFSA